MKKTTKVLLIVAGSAVAIGLIIAIAGFLIFGFKSEKRVKKDVEYSEAITVIDVDYQTEDIRLTAIEGDKLTVTYYDTEDGYISVNENDGNLSIVCKRPWYKRSFFFNYVPGVRYEVEIGIPASFGGIIKIKGNTGDVKADGFAAESLSIETDTGDLSISSITADIMTFETDTGDISFASLNTNALRIDTDTGDIEGNKLAVAESIAIETETGETELFSVTADELRVTSDTGDISVTHIKVEKSLRFSSDTGDVECYVDDPMSIFSINSDTDTGDNNLPQRQTGGTKTLDVVTDTGDIEFNFSAQ